MSNFKNSTENFKNSKNNSNIKENLIHIINDDFHTESYKCKTEIQTNISYKEKIILLMKLILIYKKQAILGVKFQTKLEENISNMSKEIDKIIEINKYNEE